MCEVCKALDAMTDEQGELRAALELERDARHRAEDEVARLRQKLLAQEAKEILKETT